MFRDEIEIGTTTTPSYRDTGLTADTAYNYYVKAFDAAGNLSEPSNVSVITTLAENPVEIGIDEAAKLVASGALISIISSNTTIQLPTDLPEGTMLKVESVVKPAPGLMRAGEAFNFIFTYPTGYEDYTGEFVLTLGFDKDLDTDKIGTQDFKEQRNNGNMLEAN